MHVSKASAIYSLLSRHRSHFFFFFFLSFGNQIFALERIGSRISYKNLLEFISLKKGLYSAWPSVGRAVGSVFSGKEAAGHA